MARISFETHNRLLAADAALRRQAGPELVAEAMDRRVPASQKSRAAYELSLDLCALSELASSYATGLGVRAAVRKRAMGAPI